MVRISQALVSSLIQLVRKRQIGDCSEVLGKGFDLTLQRKCWETLN